MTDTKMDRVMIVSIESLEVVWNQIGPGEAKNAE